MWVSVIIVIRKSTYTEHIWIYSENIEQHMRADVTGRLLLLVLLIGDRVTPR